MQFSTKRKTSIKGKPTLTSPVSFSFSTRLKTFSLGPAHKRRRRGRSSSDSLRMHTKKNQTINLYISYWPPIFLIIFLNHSTLALPLRALKQGKLGGVVHYSELVEQRLDYFSCLCLGAYVQVLGSVFGEVEWCPPSQPPAGRILLLCRAQALTRRERYWTN